MLMLFHHREQHRAISWAAAGHQALHVFKWEGLGPNCFQGRPYIAHLYDMNRARLVRTARGLGVRKIVVGRDGQYGQHVDLCGAPLEAAILRVVPAGLPTIALSIRQPWAWFILHAGKDIENRTWPLPARFDGQPVLIHAGKWFNASEIVEIFDEVNDQRIARAGQANVTLNQLKEQCGGIVGVATLSRGPASGSPWASPGGYHWRVTDARPLPFMPCRGSLGFFGVQYKLSLPEGWRNEQAALMAARARRMQ